MNEYTLLIIATVFNIIAQILLKVGSKALNNIDASKDFVSKISSMILNPLFLGALMFYGLAFITYYMSLSKIDLSKAYPLTSVTILVVIFITSVLFLGESINAAKVLGIVLCCAGIGLIFFKG